ncbi:MAG: hypothetical protein AVDCRST_MAG89-2783, partial [uncultured Gemmatimonadetes bacterium]
DDVRSPRPPVARGRVPVAGAGWGRAAFRAGGRHAEPAAGAGAAPGRPGRRGGAGRGTAGRGLRRRGQRPRGAASRASPQQQLQPRLRERARAGRGADLQPAQHLRRQPEPFRPPVPGRPGGAGHSRGLSPARCRRGGAGGHPDGRAAADASGVPARAAGRAAGGHPGHQPGPGRRAGAAGRAVRGGGPRLSLRRAARPGGAQQPGAAGHPGAGRARAGAAGAAPHHQPSRGPAHPPDDGAAAGNGGRHRRPLRGRGARGFRGAGRASRRARRAAAGPGVRRAGPGRALGHAAHGLRQPGERVAGVSAGVVAAAAGGRAGPGGVPRGERPRPRVHAAERRLVHRPLAAAGRELSPLRRHARPQRPAPGARPGFRGRPAGAAGAGNRQRAGRRGARRDGPRARHLRGRAPDRRRGRGGLSPGLAALRPRPGDAAGRVRRAAGAADRAHQRGARHLRPVPGGGRAGARAGPAHSVALGDRTV